MKKIKDQTSRQILLLNVLHFVRIKGINFFSPWERINIHRERAAWYRVQEAAKEGKVIKPPFCISEKLEKKVQLISKEMV